MALHVNAFRLTLKVKEPFITTDVKNIQVGIECIESAQVDISQNENIQDDIKCIIRKTFKLTANVQNAFKMALNH